jgi:branched-chain amino acid transport system permease protein
MTVFRQLLFNGLNAGALYALIAVGFNLIYRTTKFFNLTHGAMLTVSAYTVYWLSKQGIALYVAGACGVACAGIVGYALEKGLYLPLRRRRASNMVLLVASLGGLTMLQAVISMLFSSQPQVLESGIPPIYDVFGGVVTLTQVQMTVSAVAITAALVLMLKHTRFGKAVEAVSDDAEVAAIAGIETNKLIGYVFLLGSAIAGLAGFLVGIQSGLDPSMGMGLLLKGVVAAIVGGLGSMYGAFIGAFVVGLVENFGIWQLPSVWKDAIAFGLLILFLLVRPRGILGSRS